MCGILGFNGGSTTAPSINILKSLFELNEARGRHSSGIATSNGVLVKKPIPPSLFVDELDGLDLSGHSVLGHTRYATHGAKDELNAHPFRVGKITGVHNGVIHNHAALDKEFNLERPEGLDCDSWTIFALLDKMTPEEALPKLTGPFAITWLDESQPNKIFFFRHDNPLRITQLDGEFLYFSSIRLAKKDVDVLGEVKEYEIEEDTLYVYEGALRVEKREIKIPTPAYTSYKSYPQSNGYGRSARVKTKKRTSKSLVDTLNSTRLFGLFKNGLRLDWDGKPSSPVLIERGLDEDMSARAGIITYSGGQEFLTGELKNELLSIIELAYVISARSQYTQMGLREGYFQSQLNSSLGEVLHALHLAKSYISKYKPLSQELISDYNRLDALLDKLIKGHSGFDKEEQEEVNTLKTVL